MDMAYPQIIIGKQPDFSKPVLFLDFDGVLNAIPFKSDSLSNNYTLEKVHVADRNLSRTVKLYIDYDIVDMIRKMNCVWCTSWKEMTQTKLNPLLNVDFGYVDWRYRGPSDYGYYGKVNGIEKVCKETNCDYAVLDDDFYATKGDAIEDIIGRKGLVIAPQPETGVTRDEMAIIRRFMETREIRY